MEINITAQLGKSAVVPKYRQLGKYRLNNRVLRA
jgi:hypothetical protein